MGWRRRASIGAIGCVVVLAGCSDGRATARLDLTDGVSAEAGDIGIRNVVIVSDGAGRATLLASFVNRGDDDDLVAAVVDGVDASAGEWPLDLPAGRLVVVGPGATRVDVAELASVPGENAEVTFRFGDGPRASVSALVRAGRGIYEGVLDGSAVSAGG